MFDYTYKYYSCNYQIKKYKLYNKDIHYNTYNKDNADNKDIHYNIYILQIVQYSV